MTMTMTMTTTMILLILLILRRVVNQLMNTSSSLEGRGMKS